LASARVFFSIEQASVVASPQPTRFKSHLVGSGDAISVMALSHDLALGCRLLLFVIELRNWLAKRIFLPMATTRPPTGAMSGRICTLPYAIDICRFGTFAAYKYVACEPVWGTPRVPVKQQIRAPLCPWSSTTCLQELQR
jgi:hypothetical protein